MSGKGGGKEWCGTGQEEDELIADGKNRNYPDHKLQENLDSEIMDVLLQEARDSYDEEIVVELQSGDADELEANVERIEAWLEQWKKDNNQN